MTQEHNGDAPATDEVQGTCCARRSVLRGALALGAVGLGGGLAGCGSSKSSSDTATSGSAPAGSTSSGSTPSTPDSMAGMNMSNSAAPTSAATSSSSAASGAASGSGTSLGSASQVPVGGGMVFAKQQVVVTQPTAGTYKAFTAICTHEQCTVDDVDGGTINCACHGSKFSITDGSVKRGPADQPLAAKNVSVSGGNILLNT